MNDDKRSDERGENQKLFAIPEFHPDSLPFQEKRQPAIEGIGDGCEAGRSE
jgi:hypothetical protein